MDYIIFKIVAGAAKLFAMLPMRVLYIISDLLYPLVYYVIGYRKKIVLQNLRNSFPEKPEKEIEIISKKFYRHFCDILIETVKLFHISADELKRRMKYVDNSALVEEYQNGKHVLMVVGHYNNWEWASGLCMQGPHHFTSIYKPLTNKYFDELMMKMRTRFGGEMVSMGKVGRVFMNNIREGKLTMVNFIADQSPYEAEIQYWTTFLNQETPVFLGIEKIALKTKQPVYFASFKKVKRGYYEVTVEKLCNDCNELAPHELTEMHVRKMEELIKEDPQYWLWSHRRWKSKRKH